MLKLKVARVQSASELNENQYLSNQIMTDKSGGFLQPCYQTCMIFKLAGSSSF